MAFEMLKPELVIEYAIINIAIEDSKGSIKNFLNRLERY